MSLTATDRRLALRAVGCALIAVASLSGCGGSSAAPPTAAAFDTSSPDAACMQHQGAAAPTAGQPAGDTAQTLGVLKYYTARGAQAFCDGHPASPTDLDWMRLYVRAGADPANVARWLSPS